MCHGLTGWILPLPCGCRSLAEGVSKMRQAKPLSYCLKVTVGTGEEAFAPGEPNASSPNGLTCVSARWRLAAPADAPCGGPPACLAPLPHSHAATSPRPRYGPAAAPPRRHARRWATAPCAEPCRLWHRLRGFATPRPRGHLRAAGAAKACGAIPGGPCTAAARGVCCPVPAHRGCPCSTRATEHHPRRGGRLAAGTGRVRRARAPHAAHRLARQGRSHL